MVKPSAAQQWRWPWQSVLTRGGSGTVVDRDNRGCNGGGGGVYEVTLAALGHNLPWHDKDSGCCCGRPTCMEGGDHRQW
jgi:hypothetical protein